jgi:hypothetical protein
LSVATRFGHDAARKRSQKANGSMPSDDLTGKIALAAIETCNDVHLERGRGRNADRKTRDAIERAAIATDAAARHIVDDILAAHGPPVTAIGGTKIGYHLKHKGTDSQWKRWSNHHYSWGWRPLSYSKSSLV